MPDRDPLDFLSPSIDRPIHPGRDFADHLLDHLLADLEDVGPTDVVPLRSIETGDSTEELDESEAEVSSDETPPGVVLDLVKDTDDRSPATDRSRWILRVAAAVLIVLGGLALLQQRDDGSRLNTAVDGRLLGPAEQRATDFISARARHDGVAMQDLLADDVNIFGEYGIDGVEDYVARAEFERLTNTEISDIFCQSMTDERVSCLFTLQTDIGRHLRAEQYEAEVVLTIRDGAIVDVLAAWKGFTFEDDLVVFRKWLEQTHPEDVEVITGDPAIAVAATPESGTILAARTPEFVATTLRPITTVLADDDRFSTLVEGLEQNGVGNVVRTCSDQLVMVLAPTNAAFDRYLTATGLDRAAVLSDAALFESFLVSEVVTLSGAAGLGEQSLEVETRSGDAITIVGGTEPMAGGITIVGDVIDIETCNGIVHGVDDIRLPGN